LRPNLASPTKILLIGLQLSVADWRIGIQKATIMKQFSGHHKKVTQEEFAKLMDSVFFQEMTTLWLPMY